jgi:hypothetical protein
VLATAGLWESRRKLSPDNNGDLNYRLHIHKKLSCAIIYLFAMRIIKADVGAAW